MHTRFAASNTTAIIMEVYVDVIGQQRHRHLQALLGGLTVLFFLPTAISVSHAALAQFYLCLIVSFAMVTSRSWLDGPATGSSVTAGSELRTLATATGRLGVRGWGGRRPALAE